MAWFFSQRRLLCRSFSGFLLLRLWARDLLLLLLLPELLLSELLPEELFLLERRRDVWRLPPRARAEVVLRLRVLRERPRGLRLDLRGSA